MRNIAVFTSGGDAPGMNACIRAIVRTSIYKGLKVYGIMHGYQGMVEGQFKVLESSDVSNIIQRGGTILKTSRSKRFMTTEGMNEAYESLSAYNIEAVVAIGGDGTFAGAKEFCALHPGIPFIGLPGTIDNDLMGTDYTIGYDTAVNTVVEAVDKIRDTADSHDRLFFIEVMGKDAGLIAFRSGISVGAESILIPETETDIEKLGKLQIGWKRKKTSSIIIVAEGDDAGGAYVIAEKVKARIPHLDTRVTVLGHIQRGGSPSALDRLLASRLGYEAVLALLNGRQGEMVGIVNDKVAYTPFDKAVKNSDQISQDLLQLAEILST